MSWEWVDGYDNTTYTDDMIFEVDHGTKRVQKITGQTLISGENNSQFIRFVMDRYYDGVDLSAKSIQIIYLTESGYSDINAAVCVERSEDQIRFGWVVPAEACYEVGTTSFSIEFVGDKYTLKTQAYDLEVVDGLNGGEVVPEPEEKAWYIELQERCDFVLNKAMEAKDAAAESETNAKRSETIAQNCAEIARGAAYGSPLTASTASAMTDNTRVYVYTGSETGYTAGHWYYWNGSAWTDGGVYNSVAVDTDKTLTVEGKPADGKVTGDRLTAAEEDITGLKEDFNYYIDGNAIIDGALIALGTEKQPSSTSTGWKIIDSGSCVRDSEYNIFKYYIAPNTEWYINLDESCIWQFQSSSNIPSDVNTDIKGYTHIGAYRGFVRVPSDANYLMVSAPISGSTRHVYPYTANVTDYQKYVAKDSQAVLTGQYPIYMEKADGYVYLYMGSIYIRSSLSKTYSISALGNIFTLETSPSGQPNCIKIPYGYSLVYDYDADTLSLASSYTQYSGYKCLLLGYFSTSGNLQGGLIYDRYLFERFDDTGIPTYFKSQVDTKVAEINANLSDVGTNGFTFAFITDQHLSYNSGNTVSIIKYLQDKTRMKYVVSGGDIIDVESTKQKALAELAEYCGEFSFLNVPLFSIMGNHDYNTETTQAVSGEDLTIQNFYGVAMRQMEDIIIFDEYMDFYFIDSQSKTALVFLQTGKNNGSYHLDQNVALASILPSLPDNVIIISHLLVRTKNGEAVTNGNWDTLVNGSTAKPGLNGMAGKEKVKCIVCGHLHFDWTTYKDNFRLIVTDTNSYKSDPTTKGTVNELAFDVLTFDYTANTCKAVRIGRGADRAISLTS